MIGDNTVSNSWLRQRCDGSVGGVAAVAGFEEPLDSTAFIEAGNCGPNDSTLPVAPMSMLQKR